MWKSLQGHIQKAAMFTVGAVIAIHETVVSNVERPFLLALAGGLMGLPFVISADRKFQSGEREGS